MRRSIEETFEIPVPIIAFRGSMCDHKPDTGSSSSFFTVVPSPGSGNLSYEIHLSKTTGEGFRYRVSSSGKTLDS